MCSSRLLKGTFGSEQPSLHYHHRHSRSFSGFLCKTLLLPFVLGIAFIREAMAAFPRCVAGTKGIHSTGAQALKIKDPNYSRIRVRG